jgi:hypothetical protein
MMRPNLSVSPRTRRQIDGRAFRRGYQCGQGGGAEGAGAGPPYETIGRFQSLIGERWQFPRLGRSFRGPEIVRTLARDANLRDRAEALN